MQMGGDHAVYYALHMSEFMTTALAKPSGDVSVLKRTLDENVGNTTLMHGNGQRSASLNDYVNNPEHRVQGIMILHHGNVVYESYPGMKPNGSHLWASTAKTTVGLLATLLEADGVLDTNLPVSHYVEEFKGSAWDNVKVIDVLNMTTGLDIAETPEATINPDSMFQRQLAADFGVPNSHGIKEKGLDVLKGAKPLKGEKPGEIARYSSLATKVGVYIIEHATKRPFTELFEERVWSKIGARDSMGIIVSSDGSANPYGIVFSRLDDFARYALIYTPSWKVVSDQQIVTPAILKTLQTSGSPIAYKKGDFVNGNFLAEAFGKDQPERNSRQWDRVWTDGAMFKHGNLYQGIYVDPARDVVGVYFSTSPVTGNPDILPGYLRQAAKNLSEK